MCRGSHSFTCSALVPVGASPGGRLTWLLHRAATTLTATYNDLEGVRKLFQDNKGEIAGVILEPVVGNSGFIPPTQEFLQARTLGLGTLRRTVSKRMPSPCSHSPGPSAHRWCLAAPECAAPVQGLRDMTAEDGALLCFDEVMTGFRIAKGCAQAHFGVTPDLTTVRTGAGGLLETVTACRV